MARKMTRRMGEAMAKRIAKHYGVPAEDGPKFNDVYNGPNHPMVGWEGGPYEWPQDEAVQQLAPKGWYVEAVNHWAIALYQI